MKNLATKLAIARSSELPHSLRAAPRARATAARSAVLFALFEDGCPTVSLLRAASLARLLDADLHVMRVLPELTRVSTLFPQNNLVDAVRTVERALHANRTTRAWLRSCLGESNLARFTITHGGFVKQVVERAADLDAVLIVVPPREAQMGNTITSLACTSGVPVLVAREATKDETIVAATDLESDGYPVLRCAALLGQRLDAPVIAVHNVNPMSVVVGVDMTWPLTVLQGDPVRQARSARLLQAADKLPVDARAVVRNEVNPADAILAEAREHDADMVVVGTRKHGWLERLFGGSVAAQVVNRAKRSVLVTPLDDAEPLAVA